MKKTCLVIVAFALAGCATSPETTAWNMAREVNTPAGYQNFANRYPDSGHADEALEMVGKSKMEQILKADSVAECVRIMKTNPEPKIAAQLADLAVKAVPKETSVESLYDFLDCFKGHSGVPAARSRLEELEFNLAKGDASPGAMEFFLLRYPESRFAGEGRRILAEKSYEQVKGWANQFGYKAFIQRFPESPRAVAVRGLIKNSTPQAASQNSGETLAQAVKKSTWLKKYGCALALSAAIRKNPAEVDSLRYTLYKLEKGTVSGDLPGVCSSMKIAIRPGAGEALNEALLQMEKVEGRRTDLANLWKGYGQHNEIVRTAVGASAKVADELEAAELSEDVLGKGPLGGLDVGKEKGSTSARKANERFTIAKVTIERDRDDIKRLLVETDGLYRPLQFYLSSCLVVE
jgi:hypothetical protein